MWFWVLCPLQRKAYGGMKRIDPWSVGCFLATAVFTRMRLNGFLHPEFGKRTGGLAGSMLSLNPVGQIYDIVLCAFL